MLSEQNLSGTFKISGIEFKQVYFMKIIPLFLIFLFTTLFSTAQTVEIQNALNNNRYNDALELLDKEPITFDNLLLKAFSHEKLYNYPKALSIYEIGRAHV